MIQTSTRSCPKSQFSLQLLNRIDRRTRRLDVNYFCVQKIALQVIFFAISPLLVSNNLLATIEKETDSPRTTERHIALVRGMLTFSAYIQPLPADQQPGEAAKSQVVTPLRLASRIPKGEERPFKTDGEVVMLGHDLTLDVIKGLSGSSFLDKAKDAEVLRLPPPRKGMVLRVLVYARSTKGPVCLICDFTHDEAVQFLGSMIKNVSHEPGKALTERLKQLSDG